MTSFTCWWMSDHGKRLDSTW